MMLDVQQAQPTLLAHGQCDKAAELDELRLGKMFIEALPERVISGEMPGDRCRIGERCFLPFVVASRFPEIKQVIVLRFLEPRLGRFERTLIAAVLAVDRSSNIDAAELFDAMVADPVFENVAPRIGEGPEASRHVGANRRTLRARRPLASATIELFEHGGIGNRRRINVTDALLGHGDLLSYSDL